MIKKERGECDVSGISSSCFQTSISEVGLQETPKFRRTLANYIVPKRILWQLLVDILLNLNSNSEATQSKKNETTTHSNPPAAR